MIKRVIDLIISRVSITQNLNNIHQVKDIEISVLAVQQPEIQIT
jgi:hypothetical protein